VTDVEYDGLVYRTLLSRDLVRKLGKYEGRGETPAISEKYGGAFAMWLRQNWWEIVGGVSQAHHARGVDVRTWFWNEGAAAAGDRTRIASYLAKEASKWTQKEPPEGFTGMGRWWGRLGGSLGFEPVGEEVEITAAVWFAMERRLSRLVRWRMQRWNAWRGDGVLGRWGERRLGDGVTVFDIDPVDMMRVRKWAEKSVARAGSRGEAPGEIGAGGVTPPRRLREADRQRSGGGDSGRAPGAA
jgi:hypothetical protein